MTKVPRFIVVLVIIAVLFVINFELLGNIDKLCDKFSSNLVAFAHEV